MTTTISIEQTDCDFNKKFLQVTSDLKRYRINQLKSMEQPNIALMVEYLRSKMREGFLKPSSRANTIDRLYRFSLFHKNKSFRVMTVEDVFSFLDTLRRTEIMINCLV